MAKRNPDPESTRESIRQTASVLFTEGGVYATSLNDIARAARISKGTLYYHYPSKERLVVEIAEAYFSRITETIYGWIDGLSFDTSAQTAVKSLMRNLNRDSASMRLYFALMSEALREEGALRALSVKRQREWIVLLEVGALKLSGSGAQRFRAYSPAALALLDGFSLNRLLNETLDEELLPRLLTE